jgi:hypothetical protein
LFTGDGIPLNGRKETMELEELELKILSLLLFPEKFKHIAEESGEADFYIVADVLKTLIVKDLVRIYESDEQGNYMPVQFLAVDDLNFQWFRITTKGIIILGNYPTN